MKKPISPFSTLYAIFLLSFTAHSALAMNGAESEGEEEPNFHSAPTTPERRSTPNTSHMSRTPSPRRHASTTPRAPFPTPENPTARNRSAIDSAPSIPIAPSARPQLTNVILPPSAEGFGEIRSFSPTTLNLMEYTLPTQARHGFGHLSISALLALGRSATPPGASAHAFFSSGNVNRYGTLAARSYSRGPSVDAQDPLRSETLSNPPVLPQLGSRMESAPLGSAGSTIPSSPANHSRVDTPQVQTRRIEGAPTGSTAGTPRAQSQGTASKVILFLDDHSVTRKMAEKIGKKLPGVKSFLTGIDGESGIDHFVSRLPNDEKVRVLRYLVVHLSTLETSNFPERLKALSDQFLHIYKKNPKASVANLTQELEKSGALPTSRSQPQVIPEAHCAASASAASSPSYPVSQSAVNSVQATLPSLGLPSGSAVFDLILSDNTMNPGMSGTRFVALIRKMENLTGRLPSVIVMPTSDAGNTANPNLGYFQSLALSVFTINPAAFHEVVRGTPLETKIQEHVSIPQVIYTVSVNELEALLNRFGIYVHAAKAVAQNDYSHFIRFAQEFNNRLSDQLRERAYTRRLSGFEVDRVSTPIGSAVHPTRTLPIGEQGEAQTFNYPENGASRSLTPPDAGIVRASAGGSVSAPPVVSGIISDSDIPLFVPQIPSALPLLLTQPQQEE